MGYKDRGLRARSISSPAVERSYRVAQRWYQNLTTKMREEKAYHTLGQLIKYSAVAAVGLLIDFGSLIFFKQVIGLYYLLAIALGFIFGLIVTYVLSNRFVFGKPKDKVYKAFTLFGLIGLVGLGILSLLEWLLTSKIGINYILSKVFATVIVFIWNFFARRTLYSRDVVAELPYEL